MKMSLPQRLTFGAVVCIASACAAEAIATEDPCDLAANDVVLLSSTKKGKQFVGMFELRLNTFAEGNEPFTVAGTRSKSEFQVDEPEATYEFRDLTSAWRQLLYPPGTYSAPPHQMEVAHGGGKAKIFIPLPDSTLAAEALEWRLVLRSADNTQCLRSVPFRVLQYRGPVKGFVSKPIPARLNPNRIVSKEKSACDQSVAPSAAPSAASDAASPSPSHPRTPHCAAHTP